MIYLISYDLNKPGKDYASLHNTIKSANKWWHYLDSTWIIRTEQPVEYWSDKIRAIIDKNDHFIVVDITSQKRQGWLPNEAWEWIRNNEN